MEKGENTGFTQSCEQQLEPGLVCLKKGSCNANFQLRFLHGQKLPSSSMNQWSTPLAYEGFYVYVTESICFWVLG